MTPLWPRPLGAAVWAGLEQGSYGEGTQISQNLRVSPPGKRPETSGLWLILHPEPREEGRCLAPKQVNVGAQQGRGGRGLQEGVGLQPLLQGRKARTGKQGPSLPSATRHQRCLGKVREKRPPFFPSTVRQVLVTHSAGRSPVLASRMLGHIQELPGSPYSATGHIASPLPDSGSDPALDGGPPGQAPAWC